MTGKVWAEKDDIAWESFVIFLSQLFSLFYIYFFFLLFLAEENFNIIFKCIICYDFNFGLLINF